MSAQISNLFALTSAVAVLKTLFILYTHISNNIKTSKEAIDAQKNVQSE